MHFVDYNYILGIELFIRSFFKHTFDMYENL